MPVDFIQGKIFESLTGSAEAIRVSAFKNTIAGEKALFTGQVLSAVISERLGPDHLIAIISGQAYNLRLPVTAVSGDTLQLEVVATEPKLLFRLLNSNVQTDTQSIEQNTTQAGSQNVTVSDTARWIRTASGTLPNIDGLVAKTRVEPPRLPPDHPGATTELAENLHATVTQSGLFYESHQAQWIEGKYPLDALQREPQIHTGKLLTTLQHQSPVNTTSASIPDSLMSSAPTSSSLPSQHVQSNLIEQQLATLAGSPIEINGQAWPGQNFRLSIQRDNESKPFTETALSEWKSHLTLDLPKLGTVEATLHLSQAGVRITLNANDQEALNQLSASSNDLVDALASLQIKVLNLGLGLTDHGK